MAYGPQPRQTDWVCPDHGMEKETLCGWCSRPICNGCRDEANGRAWCPQCATKKAKDRDSSAFSRRPTGAVKNVDPYLDDSAVVERRKAVEMQVLSQQESMKGVKNADPIEKEKIEKDRKRLDDFRKMREKFNL